VRRQQQQGGGWAEWAAAAAAAGAAEEAAAAAAATAAAEDEAEKETAFIKKAQKGLKYPYTCQEEDASGRRKQLSSRRHMIGGTRARKKKTLHLLRCYEFDLRDFWEGMGVCCVAVCRCLLFQLQIRYLAAFSCHQ